MMASHQVVILKEAQEMKSLKELESYIQRPSPTTILVIAHKHKSFGMNITSDRLANLSQGDGAKAQVKVLDLVSPEGEAMGTRVELTIRI